jgi:Fic family protein
MKSFVALHVTLGAQPPRVGARLARIDTSRGREQLYQNQLPELLLGLAQETRIASITASNAIEGVVVDVRRAEKLVRLQPARVRNRNEQEFAGYRNATDGLMRQDEPEPVSVPLVLHLHRQLFGDADGRGGQLKRAQNLIVGYGGGERSILFTPTSPDDTPFALSELIDRYHVAAAEEQAHPVLLIGLFVLDFLAIHPVADGNGRLARLLTSHLLRARGYGIARYVSLEQRIFDTKERYYQALMDSQRGWHEARHDPWPWLEYLVGAVAESYAHFEERVTASGPPGRSKQQRVRGYVLDQAGTDFKIADIRRALPGVSDQTIRLVLGALRDEGAIVATGVGPSARWRRRT